MITRVVLAFGLVWLMAPYHPDLGLPVSENISCAENPLCRTAPLPDHSALLARLREVRSEMHRAGKPQAQ